MPRYAGKRMKEKRKEGRKAEQQENRKARKSESRNPDNLMQDSIHYGIILKTFLTGDFPDF
jgi:hypothetical protein